MNMAVGLPLWLSMMALTLANKAIGDTLIANAGGVAMGEIYNAVVPLPYIALCAWMYVRHTRERSAGGLLGIGVLWAISTVLVDILVARFGLGQSWRLAVVHYRLWDGYWFVLVPLLQLLAPLVAGRLVKLAPPLAQPPLN